MGAAPQNDKQEQAKLSVVPRPMSFDAIRRRSKRPWGGKLKDFKCFCCGSAARLSNHHIEPRDAGGSDSEKNKVTLCNTCHDVLEGEPWAAIVDRKETIQAKRYAQRYGKPKTLTTTSEQENWIGRSDLDKVASIRQYCLTRGVLYGSSGRCEDFRQAFRTMNSILQEMMPHDERVRVVLDHEATLHSCDAVRDVSADPLRAEADRLLHAGTQAEWVAALLAYANS
jgi:HNH endonuclease